MEKKFQVKLKNNRVLGPFDENQMEALYKQNKFDLAKEQYLIAKDRYIDEMSISIVNMKISNID